MHTALSDYPDDDFISKQSDNDLISKPWGITISCVLGFLAVLFLILLYYIRHLRRRQRRNPRVNAPNIAIDADNRNDKLESHVPNSLPISVFDAPSAQQEKMECAICLMEFRGGEKVRVLPKCRHGFHVECVDVWLESHSNCPLCRLLVEYETVEQLSA